VSGFELSNDTERAQGAKKIKEKATEKEDRETPGKGAKNEGQ
jgi:hypothetical protein